jgi:hypothetical protein
MHLQIESRAGMEILVEARRNLKSSFDFFLSNLLTMPSENKTHFSFERTRRHNCFCFRDVGSARSNAMNGRQRWVDASIVDSTVVECSTSKSLGMIFVEIH